MDGDNFSEFSKLDYQKSIHLNLALRNFRTNGSSDLLCC